LRVAVVGAGPAEIKSVTKVFDKVAANPAFRFFGFVEFGTDVTLDDMKRYYHQVIFTTGAQTDKYLEVPGADLEGSHAATEFVAWYNGHPDYRHYSFDLTHAPQPGQGSLYARPARPGSGRLYRPGD
jgi:NADPH-dependent glutamate synthase beta subunit-like oxidoreductase